MSRSASTSPLAAYLLRCKRACSVRAVSYAAFAVWALLLFIAATSLAATHFYALPRPDERDAELTAALNSMRGETERGSWLAVHVLYSKCRCSQRIVQHLATSERPRSIREKLLVMGDPFAPHLQQALARRDIALVPATEQELRERFHVRAAPLLLVLDGVGSLRYAGGYSDHKQGARLADVEIMRALIANGAPDSLPLFGCAVSRELQNLLDPLSLKQLQLNE